jgi:4-hydroxy-4-methyl-2-oxoglutarate aldolase
MPEHPLSGLSAATVHEANGGNGALPSAIKPVDKSFRICGPAFTVDCPAGDNLWLHRAVYAAVRGDILVADVRGHTEAGYWGEILSHAALARGLGGLVISGGVRDTEEISALSFPVFAAAICIRGTTKDPNGDGHLREDIRLGHAAVRTGDVVVGDADGVVIVPADQAQAVAMRARARVTAEHQMVERLGRGDSTLDILGLPT